MTILSKKEVHKSDEKKCDNSHRGAHNHGHGLPVQQHTQGRERNSEERLSHGQCHWQSRDEKGQRQLNVLENGQNGMKRRIKASPMRSSRSCKLHVGSPRSWSSSPNSSPKAGPSSLCDVNRNDAECNSGDEYEHVSTKQYSATEWSERDCKFLERMRKRGLVVKKMKEDGACLFRAVADQVYGDQEMHDVVRKHCMDYIASNRDYYSQYMTEDFDSYIGRKRQLQTHGNHIEIQAMCEMYNRRIEVYSYKKDPINIFDIPNTSGTTNEPIRLSYERGSHYNSIVDPYKATVGVGLGLPSFSPGSADKNLVKEGIRQSEDLLLEQTMLEDKLRATDWEATNELIESQVARESYVQWFKESEKRKRISNNGTSSIYGCTSSSLTSPRDVSSPSMYHSSSDLRSNSPQHKPTGTSPKNAKSRSPCSNKRDSVSPKNPLYKSRGSHMIRSPVESSNSTKSYDTRKTSTARSNAQSPSDFHINEQASFLNELSPEMFGMTDWEDFDIITQVLATSQEEYLDNLRKQQQKGKDGSSAE